MMFIRDDRDEGFLYRNFLLYVLLDYFYIQFKKGFTDKRKHCIFIDIFI